jgi:membrane-associated phospholipid phosphatase
MLVLDLSIALYRGISIGWEDYLPASILPIFSMCIGQFYRRFRPDEMIAKPFIFFSLFFFYTIFMSSFNSLLLPCLNPRIDPILQSIDYFIGFHWLDIARTFAQWPMVCEALKYVYQSSIFQIMGVVLLLGYFRKDRSLVNMFFTCIIGVTITISFWFVFPSSGPSSFVLQDVLPEEFPFVVNHVYGERMNDLFAHGMDLISPKQTLGLVSFPSFHTVMALMCVWYSRPLKWVFPVLLVFNIFMIPAVIIHGAHYLVDIIGGVITFTLAAFLTHSLVPKIDPTLKDHKNHKDVSLS